MYPANIVHATSSAHYSHVQLSAAILLCTLPLQLYYPVHTAATPYSAHYIQCTSGPPKADVTAQYVISGL